MFILVMLFLLIVQIKAPDPAIQEIKERTDEVDRQDGAGSRTQYIDNKYAPSGHDSEGRKLEKKLQRDLDYKCEGQMQFVLQIKPTTT